VQLDPARWESRLGRAWALEGLRRPGEARAEYEKVLAIAPRQDDALYGRATALKSEGDLPAALSGFKEYLGLPKASRLKEAQNQLASIDLRLRNAPPAVARTAAKAAGASLRSEYEKVLAIAPRQDDALYGRATALKSEGDLPAALSGFKEYLGLPKASRLKEAQNQLASIDLRLRNAPPAVARTAAKAAGASLDLAKLPQGADPGSSPEDLPPEDAPSVVR